MANLLLNNLDVTPGTVKRLIKRYLVHVCDPFGARLHPTLRLPLSAGSSVSLTPGIALPLRPTALTPREHKTPLSLLKRKAERHILASAINSTGSTAPLRILHLSNDLLIVNKPYNIASDDADYLGRLRDLVQARAPQAATENSQQLLLQVSALDKGESGALVFARTEDARERLARLFDPGRLIARPIYWALTTRVYRDAPFGEIYNLLYSGKADHRARFANTPRYTSHQHLRKDVLDEGTPAIAQWRHLSTHIARCSAKRRKLGLYELAPITLHSPGQLRVQLAEQLKTPVVGDWLYAPRSQLALRLAPRMPLHLHLYQMRIPQADGSNLTVKAPIPPHFVLTMSKFPLFLPLRPKLKRPRFPSNVKRIVDRYIPGQRQK